MVYPATPIYGIIGVSKSGQAPHIVLWKSAYSNAPAPRAMLKTHRGPVEAIANRTVLTWCRQESISSKLGHSNKKEKGKSLSPSLSLISLAKNRVWWEENYCFACSKVFSRRSRPYPRWSTEREQWPFLVGVVLFARLSKPVVKTPLQSHWCDVRRSAFFCW